MSSSLERRTQTRLDHIQRTQAWSRPSISKCKSQIKIVYLALQGSGPRANQKTAHRHACYNATMKLISAITPSHTSPRTVVLVVLHPLRSGQPPVGRERCGNCILGEIRTRRVSSRLGVGCLQRCCSILFCI
jgi:hypothetical protein